MGRYSNEFKQRMIQKLMLPGGPSARALAETSGVSQVTLSRWLRQAASVALVANDTDKKPPPREARRPEDWSPDERLRVVRETAGLMGSELGVYLRREGLHEATVTEWREQALAALGGSARARTKEQQRIRELERELNRKDKALAETAALLVLAKKVHALWGDEDDDTSGRSGQMILSLVDEAVRSGARLQKACEVIELPARTLQRWREQGPQGGEDRRHGSTTPPAQQAERGGAREDGAGRHQRRPCATSRRGRSCRSLADQGVYVCSESTMYRVLEERPAEDASWAREGTHEQAPEAPRGATGPNQLLCWDITYLPAAVRGKFLLPLRVRRRVEPQDRGLGRQRQASATTSRRSSSKPPATSFASKTKGIVLHSDNGSPMKGATMLAMMTSLGVTFLRSAGRA
jgi:transposase-like protein